MIKDTASFEKFRKELTECLGATFSVVGQVITSIDAKSRKFEEKVSKIHREIPPKDRNKFIPLTHSFFHLVQSIFAPTIEKFPQLFPKE